jgi:hypothetical protein
MMQQMHELRHVQYQDYIASDCSVANKRRTVRDFEENGHSQTSGGYRVMLSAQCHIDMALIPNHYKATA